MNNFKIIYKILKQLDNHKGDESFSYESISATSLGIPFSQWEQLMIELQENGYIKGLVYDQTLSEKFPHIEEPINPLITLTGMQYLAENSMMKKAENALKLAAEFI